MFAEPKSGYVELLRTGSVGDASYLRKIYIDIRYSTKQISIGKPFLVNSNPTVAESGQTFKISLLMYYWHIAPGRKRVIRSLVVLFTDLGKNAVTESSSLNLSCVAA